MKGILYLIPVPISEDDNSHLVYPVGQNPMSHGVYPLLEKTINSLDEFIVEDLKTARRSLRKIGFKGAFDKIIFHVLNEHTDLKSIDKFISSAEKNIGLMSEAGMPCIADPGSEIVKLAHKKNMRVVPLYGQSSIFLALAASGLNGQNFCFHGYLPKSQSERKKKLKEITPSRPSPKGKEFGVQLSSANWQRVGGGMTHIFIETPYRNNHLLEDILSTCSPEILLCIAVNVTGSSEKIITKSISEWNRGEVPDLNKQLAVFLLGR